MRKEKEHCPWRLKTHKQETEFGKGGCLLDAHHGALVYSLSSSLDMYFISSFGKWSVPTNEIRRKRYLCCFVLADTFLLVVGSLIAFFGGVVLASLTEVSFNWLVIIFPFLKFQSQMIGECITLSISSVKLTLLAIELSLIFICL